MRHHGSPAAIADPMVDAWSLIFLCAGGARDTCPPSVVARCVARVVRDHAARVSDRAGRRLDDWADPRRSATTAPGTTHPRGDGDDLRLGGDCRSRAAGPRRARHVERAGRRRGKRSGRGRGRARGRFGGDRRYAACGHARRNPDGQPLWTVARDRHRRERRIFISETASGTVSAFDQSQSVPGEELRPAAIWRSGQFLVPWPRSGIAMEPGRTPVL